MAKLVEIAIKKFRSIENLRLEFDHKQNLICLIGRGDSGKTTILEAISTVLSPTWNLTFHDTDFHNCDHESPIEIYASLIDIPEKLLSEQRFGLHVRAFNTKTSEITDDFIDREADAEFKPLLTIKLIVDQFLEPQWTVCNSRNQEDKIISGSERALLSCYMVSDSIDRHFSWNKGNPLYSLLKASEKQEVQDENNIVIQSLRSAKKRIDEHVFSELKEVTDLITTQVAGLGLNILNTNTTLDFKELSIKDGRVSLHEDMIPFRLKGKGSKRIISLAIQLALVQNGGIMLVDEIEQGLEPDRIKQLIRSLKVIEQGQIFLTTHSREVITEVGADSLCLVLRDKDDDKVEGRKLDLDNDSLTKAVRGCPEAFFAKKIIMCEGATEIGICRALDKYRKIKGKQQMSFKDCAYVDGTGNSLVDRAIVLHEADLKTAILCDSDPTPVNAHKNDLKLMGIQIFDCEDPNCLEQQIFKDISWNGLTELIQYVVKVRKGNDLIGFESAVKVKFPKGALFDENWLGIDSPQLRTALAAASIKGDEWFKRIDHGEFLGDTVFKYFDEMREDAHLKIMLNNLSNWIDN